MKANEILVQLINRGVVHSIKDEYFLTDRLDKMDRDDKLEANLLVMEEPVEASNMDLYPKEIREAGIAKKVEAVLDYCKVPAVIVKGNSRFLVRSADKLSKGELMSIILNVEYKPEVILKCITDYYATMEYPKAFKRFILEGDLVALYSDYIKGDTSLESPEKPDNQSWG
jgi:hypothetical protein